VASEQPQVDVDPFIAGRRNVRARGDPVADHTGVDRRRPVCPHTLQKETLPGSQSNACVVSLLVPGIVKLRPFDAT
jgi:hypothetical protein